MEDGKHEEESKDERATFAKEECIGPGRGGAEPEHESCEPQAGRQRCRPVAFGMSLIEPRMYALAGLKPRDPVWAISGWAPGAERISSS